MFRAFRPSSSDFAVNMQATCQADERDLGEAIDATSVAQSRRKLALPAGALLYDDDEFVMLDSRIQGLRGDLEGVRARGQGQTGFDIAASPAVHNYLLSDYPRHWRCQPAGIPRVPPPASVPPTADVPPLAGVAAAAGFAGGIAVAAAMEGALVGGVAVPVVIMSPIIVPVLAATAMTSGIATAISLMRTQGRNATPHPAFSRYDGITRILECGPSDGRADVESKIMQKHAEVIARRAAYDDIVKAVLVYSQLRGWDDASSFDSEDRAIVENTWAARQVTALKLAIDRGWWSATSETGFRGQIQWARANTLWVKSIHILTTATTTVTAAAAGIAGDAPEYGAFDAFNRPLWPLGVRVTYTTVPALAATSLTASLNGTLDVASIQSNTNVHQHSSDTPLRAVTLTRERPVSCAWCVQIHPTGPWLAAFKDDS